MEHQDLSSNETHLFPDVTGNEGTEAPQVFHRQAAYFTRRQILGGAIGLGGVLAFGSFGLESPLAHASAGQVQQASTTPLWDTYSDTWVGIDDLGRTLPTYSDVGAPRQKYVGMFYEVWHTEIGAGATGIYDVSQILANNPTTVMGETTSPPWGPYGQFHYWGQPLLGYFSDTDNYVLHKDAQMLSDAGVDTIVIDLTNYSNGSNYYKTEWLNLMSVWDSIRQNGGKTPQVMFIMPFSQGNGAACVNALYQDLYSQNLYQDLWFQWQGKPLMLADPSWISDPTQASFFTYRINQPGYGAGSQNAWGWLSTYPQTPYYTSSNPSEQVTVSPAQNASVAGVGPIAMSSRDSNNHYIARGKSFHSGAEYASNNPIDPNYPSAYGYNFAEEWQRALSLDASFVLVSNWNEWIAIRFQSWNGDSGPNALVDEFTPEFSRDIQPMTGGYKDDFYNQLVSYIRQYKGVRQIPAPSAPTTITIDGSFSDWTNVAPEYRDDVGDTVHRNSPSFGGYLTYTDTTGRNDFVIAKVARDNNNIYFYVKTSAAITPYTDPNWMQLFIRTNPALPNWEGYNYILNRVGVSATTTTLEKSTGGWNWTTVDSSISYKVSGQELELAIPRADLGFGNTSNPIQFDFKWADNINPNSDSSEFYLHGDTAPNERFAYRFSEVAQANGPVKLSNFGFEVPAVGNSYSYGPMTAGWTFDSGSGVQGNGSGFGASASAPEGTQTAFLQGTGTITQTVSFPAGSYVVNFQAARRTSHGGQQSFNVTIDGATVGSFSPTSGNFSAFSTSAFTVTAANHTLQFVGTTSGDNTDFIDAVTITPATAGNGNGINLAAGKSVTVSSTVNSGWPGSSLTDGNLASAWSSQNTGGSTANEWAYVDLGSTTAFNRVTLFPRTQQGAVYCFPQAFKIQGSNDASSWNDLLTETNYPAPPDANSGITLNTGTQTYRYVRVLVSQARPDNFNNYYVQLAELAVYNNALSTGDPVTVSSTVGGTWVGSNLTDGNLTTNWSSQNTGGSSVNEWAYVDLGSATAFSRVTLFPRVGGGVIYCFPQAFKIQGSNDASSWTDLVSETNYPAPPDANSGMALTTGAQTYRYVRVLVTQARADNNNNYYVQLGELEVDQ